MKAVHVLALIAGVFLMLGTESENAATNMIGLLLVVYECDKLNLLSNENR